MTHIEIYNQIIENRLQNPLSKDEYGEKHHIKPKSIYPELANDPDNIVRLTAQEHFLCHYHLWKHYRDELKDKAAARKMCYAFNMMKRIIQKCNDIEMMSQLYAEVRKDLSEACKNPSEETRKKLSKAMKGKHHSEQTRRKLSEAKKGKPAWNRGKHLSEETRKKLSKALKNPSEETRKKLSEARKNLSEETRRKLIEARKGRHWYNNGLKNVFTYECPEGFVAGRIK